MKSRYLSKPIFNALLLLLMPENAEALRLSLDYGMRIGDVLRIPTSAMQAGHWSFKEQKTGKRRRGFALSIWSANAYRAVTDGSE